MGSKRRRLGVKKTKTNKLRGRRKKSKKMIFSGFLAFSSSGNWWLKKTTDKRPGGGFKYRTVVWADVKNQV